MTSLDELLAVATEVAREAGELLRLGLEDPRVVLGTKSSPTDLVTEVDRRSEALILERLLARRPDDGLLGEEGGTRAGSSGVRWVVDPLDGTTNYLYGYPAFAVSIAAEREGRACVGVVHDPLREVTYTATLGGGARCDGRSIAVTAAADLATALVGTGFSYDPDRRALQADVARQVLPRVRDLRRAGAASLDLCWVAAGHLDGFYERGLAPWDHTAGALIAREAGARVEDLWGGEPSGEFVLAAAPDIFEPLASLLRAAGAGEA